MRRSPPRRIAAYAPSGRAPAAASAILAILLAGCSYSQDSATREGSKIQAEVVAEVDEFRRTQLIDPREPGGAEVVAAEVQVPARLTLDDAIRIATENNRDYQSRRESLFLAALDLGLTRRDFLRPVFDGSVNWNLTDGSELSSTDVLGLSIGGDYLLYTGGTLRADGSVVMRNDSGSVGPDQSTSGTGTIALEQPLLQGAGHDIAFEQLTQGERDLLYAARDFELYRLEFVVTITDDYYRLLSQERQLDNTRQNIERQNFAYEQAQALFSIGRGDKLSVFRAEQSLFSAQNQLLSDEQAFRVALDRFKIQLGVPTSVEFEVEDELPTINELHVDLRAAIEAALHNRLDVRTERERVEDQERRVRIAKNALMPRFDLSASYTKNTDAETSLAGLDFVEEIAAVGLDLEIPFDRKPQRNAYREALIALDQVRRNRDRFEDEVVLEVRNLIGALEQRRAQIEIGVREIESLELSAEKAQLEVEQGSATNRDLTEAIDDLTAAQNQQLDRIVDHEIARLTLLRQLGLLFVDPEGRVEE